MRALLTCCARAQAGCSLNRDRLAVVFMECSRCGSSPSNWKWIACLSPSVYHDCRNVYQQLSKLGSLELQAVLNKMLDEVATPIKFCQYKLHGPSGADGGLKVPDSPSGKLIQVHFTLQANLDKRVGICSQGG